MYYKEINGRIVFSDCKTLFIESENRWVCNPPEEQIFAEGWQVYVPPVIPPTPQTEPSDDEIVQAVKRMLASSVEEMTDEEALEVAALFPTWESAVEAGVEVPIGKRLWYDGKLYKVLQAHTPQLNWTPDTAVSLYVEVSIEEIPEWVQPTGANPYMKDDKVKHNGHTWQSLIDNNVWEPGAVGTESLWTQLD